MAASPKKAFPLRLDPALYAAVERSAAADLRSVNAQLECLLREALARRGVKLAQPVPARRGRPPARAADDAADADGTPDTPDIPDTGGAPGTDAAAGTDEASPPAA